MSNHEPVVGYDDKATRSLLEEEQKLIELHRSRLSEAEWSGIGLSGGGIRSAAFCLGALQSLANRDVLKSFDYISSVSGGGYTAAGLQWWWLTNSQSGASRSNFPYGSDLRSDSRLLAFLRGHARYLTPGGGFNFWAIPALIFRTVFLNLIVWIPISAAAYIALFCMGALANAASHGFFADSLVRYLRPDFLTGNTHTLFNLLLWLTLIIVVLCCYFAILLTIFSSIIPPDTFDTSSTRLGRILKTSILAIVTLLITAFGYGLLSYDNGGAVTKFLIYLPLPLLLALLITIAFQVFGNLSFNEQYRARRLAEIYGGKCLVLIIGLSLLTIIPTLVHLVPARSDLTAKMIIGTISTASGVITGLYGHIAQTSESRWSPVSQNLASVCAGLFLYSIAVISYLFADYALPSDDISAIVQDFKTDSARALIYIMIAFSFYVAWSTNLNYLGLYRFYRDRLMEAFMPSPQSLASWSTQYSLADRCSLVSLWPQTAEECALLKKVEHPYPIFNTNVILVNDPSPKTFERGGDNFILSPLFVGSTSTSWQRTGEYIDSHAPLTLPTAMAASGAAINSNAAYIGEGITREKLVSIAMMLMNLRLGWWFSNIKKRPGKPNHIRPGFTSGVLGWGYKSNSRFVELSDGGDFDNLGLYELVRRRLRIIFVIDGEEDANSAMPALVSTTQRICDDFGVIIDLDRRIDDLMPGPVSGFPPRVEFSKLSYFVAPINYPDDKQPGALVYLKARLIPEMDFILRGFRAKNSNFPNEPTLNQFFEPEQFEAYRSLGFVSMDTLLDKFRIRGALPSSSTILNPPKTSSSAS